MTAAGGLTAGSGRPGVGRAVAARRQRRIVVFMGHGGRAIRLRLPKGVQCHAGDRRVLRNAGELCRDVFRREDVVDTSCRDRAARHGVVLRRVVLREGDAALGLDRLQADRPVARRSGENHANGLVTSVLGQSLEKAINGTGGYVPSREGEA